jgi:hypothetical protein
MNYLSDDAGGAAGQQGSQGVINTARAQRILGSGIGSIVQKVASESGMNPKELAAMVSIESGGDPGASTGSYHGLLQLSKEEFAQHGGTDIFDAEQNLRAGAAIIKEKAQRFTREFGHAPSVSELYLMHQQGEAGLRAHEKNPDLPAWQNMYSTSEGQNKGEGWAKKAIWGNVPTDMRAQFGSVDNISSREFMAVWTSKLLGIPYQQALAMQSSNSTRA